MDLRRNYVVEKHLRQPLKWPQNRFDVWCPNLKPIGNYVVWSNESKSHLRQNLMVERSLRTRSKVTPFAMASFWHLFYLYCQKIKPVSHRREYDLYNKSCTWDKITWLKYHLRQPLDWPQNLFYWTHDVHIWNQLGAMAIWFLESKSPN